MNSNYTLLCLEANWRKYLKDRGHYVYRDGTYLPVIRSGNDKKTRYRWLLLISEVPKRFLSKAERTRIHQHIKQAKAQKEATYLVVGFVQEPRRVVILPARAALKTRYVRSDKGGIAWGD